MIEFFQTYGQTIAFVLFIGFLISLLLLRPKGACCRTVNKYQKAAIMDKYQQRSDKKEIER